MLSTSSPLPVCVQSASNLKIAFCFNSAGNILTAFVLLIWHAKNVFIMIRYWIFHDRAKAMYPKQSDYIEVAQGDIFMEQKMWFGLVLGSFAILKKVLGPIMSNFWGHLFFIFSKHGGVRTKNLHNIFFIKLFFWILKIFLFCIKIG